MKTTVVNLVDDLDGSPADETVRLALDDTSYEIDLSIGNAKALRDILAPYTSAGTKISTRTGASARTRHEPPIRRDRQASARVREWAAEQGIPVAARGRINADVLRAFAVAHPHG